MVNALIEYLFNTRPLSFDVLGGAFLFTIIVALIYGVFGKLIIKKLPLFYRKTARRLKSFSLYYGFISLILYLVRTERIPYLSMRIWLWLWFLGFWLMTIIIIVKEIRRIPSRRTRHTAEIKQKRYFDN